MKLFVSLIVALVALPGAVVAQSPSPYAGQDSRQIKALSAEDVRGYLSGEGLGMAKAGELNHFPGPKHVLAMADQLALTADQRTKIEDIAAKMTAAAVPIGRQIVDAEQRLDAAFASATIDQQSLRQQTERIGELQGQLRDVHLSAHLATRATLRQDQIAKYDQMRGYGATTNPDEHMHHAM
jgi:Spy/CpxP family protein refolding chaperone